ncbi:hypothetical protein [Oceanobacillus kapialis]|uniref:Uncharacterized protein n=1 Tax=Oceanobacillus kapialis TaxID=481353 RepID=A0ABW5Q3P8_9BACI
MNFEIMPLVLFGILFPIVIGILLRIPKLIIEIKQHKQWTFDWVKFIAIAIPALFVIALSISPYLSIPLDYMKIPIIFMEGTPTIETVAGIVLGYTFLDCLKK